MTPTLGTSPKASGTSHLDPRRSWSHVASGTVLSCVNTHTEIGTNTTPASSSQPKKGLATRSSTKDSQYASRNDDLFADVITPYIIGRESNSTLIEITNIKDTNALKTFLCSYNRDDQYPFFGALLKTRKYLQRTFIETCWDTKSDVYQRLISGGLELDKTTTIKGYPSLPTDAKVQRVHVDNLPLKEPRLLQDLIRQRFSSLGEVLDIGFHLDGRMFYGSGYVVLNLNTKQRATEKLSRELPWATEGRKLLLKWDDMPQYCRYCQSLEHCKADCAELHNLKVCTECNEHGHRSPQCPRTSSTVPHKVITVAEMKPRKSAKKPAASTTATSPAPAKPTPSNSTAAAPPAFSFDKARIPPVQPIRHTNRGSTEQPSSSAERRIAPASPMQETRTGKPNRLRSDSDPTNESSSPDAKRLKPSSMELVVYQSEPANTARLADSSGASRKAITAPRL
ncbi:hypothetical protein MBANPS3_011639 [Mucor bainieri]